MRMSNFALKPIKLTLFEATDGDLAAAPKTPILKSQRTPKDFRNPTIKTDRRLNRDSSYVAEFVNTPIRLEDVAIELSGPRCSTAFARLWSRRRRCAARHPVPVVGADIPWRRGERSAGDRRQEGVKRGRTPSFTAPPGPAASRLTRRSR
jgi:hypothetical protein